MKVIPWNKRRELTPLRDDFDDLLNRFVTNRWLDGEIDGDLPAAMRGGVVPPVNVAETEKDWIVTLELPGMEEKEIAVQLMGRQLVVSGERRFEEQKKGKEFQRIEFRYGSFQRSIELPQNASLNAKDLCATYKHGILEITVPKLEPTPTAKIPVKGG
jgi:HSP20 family protein